MKKTLPIGTIVTLKNGGLKLMILNRFPFYNFQNNIGYFEYSACIYPSGLTDDQLCYFNDEDIEKVWFEGYIDDKEIIAQELFSQQLNQIDYPHFTIGEVLSNLNSKN